VVADTVGAGDAFSAGLLDALWQRGLLGPAGGSPAAPGAAEAASAGRATPLGRIAARDVAEVVDWAVLVATVTCERPGADPPTRREVLQAR
jgi:fructokinase